MYHITLYPPGSDAPFEFDVKTYSIKDGVLHFRDAEESAQPTDISNTVPFLIRQPATEKAATQSRPPRRTSSGPTAWS